MTNHPNRSRQTICIVYDGQYRWGAKWTDLRAAMERLGWTHVGSRWSMPAERRDPSLGQTDHYTALCELVQPEPGYGPEDEIDEAGHHPVLVYRPDWGDDWEFCVA